MTQIISSNTTWSGNIMLTDDIQIASGVTLSVAPGADVIGNGHTIQAFGTLAADGTATTPEQFQDVDFGLSSDYKNPGHIAVDYASISGGAFLTASGNPGYGAWSLINSTLQGLPYIYVWYPTANVPGRPV